jgi:hypothetical protein
VNSSNQASQDTAAAAHLTTLQPKCREDQDLAAGAVLESTTEAGQGTATPQEGDLVRQLLQLLLCIH